ncbi:MAG: hypothetical protein JWL71_4645 [Acidobacteria bacterium]|nr:hypothetical protein [Acidobacteriota bacterium]
MATARITGALLDALGEPAAAALTEVLNAHQRASTEAAMTQCGERFERRLVEETSSLRLELSQLRGDMRERFVELRREMMDARRDMAEGRFELLKWAFAFWVGQLAAVAGIVGVLLRTLPGR